jgi:hypothetical protein
MSPKRKRSSSARTSSPQRTSKRKSIKKVDREASSDNKPTRNSKNRKDTKTKGSEQVKYDVGEEVQYDPIHKGSTRRAQGKITKVLTGPKVIRKGFC